MAGQPVNKHFSEVLSGFKRKKVCPVNNMSFGHSGKILDNFSYESKRAL